MYQKSLLEIMNHLILMIVNLRTGTGGIYTQDVEGLRDDFIDDAFGEESDTYWNNISKQQAFFQTCNYFIKRTILKHFFLCT